MPFEWTRAKLQEGADNNKPKSGFGKKGSRVEFVVKMGIIARDLMIGNPKLEEQILEKVPSHNAILAGFHDRDNGPTFLNGDFLEQYKFFL